MTERSYIQPGWNSPALDAGARGQDSKILTAIADVLTRACPNPARIRAERRGSEAGPNLARYGRKVCRGQGLKNPTVTSVMDSEGQGLKTP